MFMQSFVICAVSFSLQSSAVSQANLQIQSFAKALGGFGTRAEPPGNGAPDGCP